MPERLTLLLPIRLPLRLVPLAHTTPERVVLRDADDVAGNLGGSAPVAHGRTPFAGPWRAVGEAAARHLFESGLMEGCGAL